MNFSDIPKVELHMHLEGAAPPPFIRKLAEEKNINLQGVFNDDGTYCFDNFVHFLSVYEEACKVLKTPEDFYRLTYEVCKESASHGVIYTESFLAPDFCGQGDVVAWQEYVKAMEEASQKAEQDFDIIFKGIATIVRHFGPDQAKLIAKCAAASAGSWLTGFGLAGDEGQFEPKDFAYCFDMAKEAGLKLTAHAGEFGGADSVANAIKDLNIIRVGHGVRSTEDPKVVEYLAANDIVLEVCPGSNVALGLYDSLDAHPIDKLRAAGVQVTVSSDDPPFFHTDMTKEYQQLHALKGWDVKDFSEVNTVAANAAFCDQATKDKLLEKISNYAASNPSFA